MGEDRIADRSPDIGGPPRRTARRLIGALAGVAAAILLPSCGGCSTTAKRLAYEGFWRDRWQRPEAVVSALALQPGDRVADLGAGGGYFTFRLADAVGPEGRVYAVDVDRGLLDYVREQAQARGYGNVETVLATPDDPRLPAPVDLLFTCNTYHHLADRSAYFARARRHLMPDGRLAIIDATREGWFARLFGHGTPAAVIRTEVEAAGYRLDTAHGFLPRQSFLVFAPGPG